jgi:hypothetical protein
MTPARMASSIRLLNRRRRMKDRSIIADETNSNKNNVARKVNLYHENFSDVERSKNAASPPACAIDKQETRSEQISPGLGFREKVNGVQVE